MELIYRFDPFQPLVLSRPADAQAGIATLIEGNQRLVELIAEMQRATIEGSRANDQRVVPVDLFSMGLPLRSGTTRDQAPFALVLGCADARVPVESVFDQGFNDLFVVRVAGNVVGTDGIGSFQYAMASLESVKLVVVLGHTCCGAVTAAVDAYLSPSGYGDIAFSHSLRLLVDRIAIAARGCAAMLEKRYGANVHQHPEFRALLIESTVYLNAALTAFDLRRELHGEREHAVEVVYGICDISTMLVSDHPRGTKPRLVAPPRRAEEFGELAEKIIGSLASAYGLERRAAPKRSKKAPVKKRKR